MKYILTLLLSFVFFSVSAQQNITTIIDLPTPDGSKIQKTLHLPSTDTTFILKQEVDKEIYTYTITKKSDTIQVNCVFVVRGKESSCVFKIQLKTNEGKVVPQRQQQSAILKHG